MSTKASVKTVCIGGSGKDEHYRYKRNVVEVTYQAAEGGQTVILNLDSHRPTTGRIPICLRGGKGQDVCGGQDASGEEDEAPSMGASRAGRMPVEWRLCCKEEFRAPRLRMNSLSP